MAILVDYSGVSLATVFAMGQAPLSEDLIRHMILNSLRGHNLKYRKKYGRMVLACDSGSWRKSVYPEYKASRKKNRDADTKNDWEKIFKILNTIREELVEHMPYPVIAVPDAEADDIIGVLAGEYYQEFGQHEPCMIISADKDFIQLQKHSGVDQYSPLTKKLIVDKDPRGYLLDHVMRGDAGDGVPNVLSADNVFVEGIRQTPLRAKRKDEIIAICLGGDPEKDLPKDVLANMKRNAKMIDFALIPNSIKTAILNEYKSICPAPNNKVLKYLISKQCRELVSCAEEFFTPTQL